MRLWGPNSFLIYSLLLGHWESSLPYYVLPALCTGFVWARSSTANSQGAAPALWQLAQIQTFEPPGGLHPIPVSCWIPTGTLGFMCPVLLGV